VARLLVVCGVPHSLSGLVKRRKRKTTVRLPGVRPAPDLVGRDFEPREPNRLWGADLTEVQTWEGRLYLAVVIDCFSRRVVGWSMRDECAQSSSSRRSRWR
jgi:putative transposase